MAKKYTRESALAKIVFLISDHFDITKKEAQELDPSTTLESLGDAADAFDLFDDIEMLFKIDLGEEERDTVNTVQELINYVYQRLEL